ncbi:major facilitator superfamily domain-containing protein [Umbelopsis sp. AD052]|nr:major facilitator superfamily domain-containing protein [Umbelopsis sp. AD052]
MALEFSYLTEVFTGQTDSFRISFVGTLSATFIVGGGILVAPLVQLIGHRNVMLIGGFLSPLGLIAASFATAPWQLYLSEGALFGIGGCFLYNPSVYLPAQWFKKNRALATGLGVCGTGIGGLGFSLITQKLIVTVGYRMALRYLGIMCWVLLMVACALARIRWPATGLKNYHWIDTSILTTNFVIYMFFGGTVIISYATPFFLLPQYAATIGISAADASTVIGVMSACNAVSRVLLGYLADRFGRINAMFLVTFLAGFFMMVVWIEVNSIGTLYAIGILYGLTGGGFLALVPAVTAELVPVKNISQGMNFLFLSMVPGGLLGTPISGLLKDHAGFTAAIEFAGATTVLSALILFVLRQRLSHNKFFIKI